MNHQHILEMNNDELRHAVTNWMEPKPVASKTYSDWDREQGDGYRYLEVYSEKGWWKIAVNIDPVNYHQMFEVIPDWEPAKNLIYSIDVVVEVEEKIKKEGLLSEYVLALQQLITIEKPFFGTYPELFKMVHAPAVLRCRAAMMAVACHEASMKGKESA